MYTAAVFLLIAGLFFIGRGEPNPLHDPWSRKVTSTTDHTSLIKRDVWGAYLVAAGFWCIAFRHLFQALM